ncbi:MAG: c-type cytochrome [Candidatus Thiothrix sulfatifontis]|nr:MAG: c-type cytochrome [Candidatus Thiothrix sulfatifontis]
MKLKYALIPLLLLTMIGSTQADEKKVVEKAAKTPESKTVAVPAPAADSVSKDELREMIRELIQEEMANLQPTSNTESKPVAPAHAAKAGEILAHTCAGCHGTNGTLENEAFMPLAGMPEQEFVKTMLDFRDGARQSTLMGTVANGLSEQQIRDMARYFMEVSP